MGLTASHSVTGLLALNLVLGLVSILVSPASWVPVLVIGILASVSVWLAVRKPEVRYSKAAFGVLVLLGVALILMSASTAQAQVIRTVDAGAAESTTDVWALDTDTLYVCYRVAANQQLKVAASTDRGVTWSNATIAQGGDFHFEPGEVVNDCSISGANLTVVVSWYNATTFDPMVSYSTDGGSTWTDTIVDDGTEINGNGIRVAAINETRWYVYGSWDDGAVLVNDDVFCSTTDTGASYTCTQVSGSNGFYADMEVLNSQEIILTGRSSGADLFVHRSNDGGSTWENIETDRPATVASALGAIDYDTWIFGDERSSSSPDILTTNCSNDGGTTIPVPRCAQFDMSGDSTLDRWGSLEIEATPSGLPYYFAYKDPVNGAINVAEKTNNGGSGDRTWAGNTTICASACDGLGLHVFGTGSWLVSYTETGGGAFVAGLGLSTSQAQATGLTDGQDIRISYTNSPLIYVLHEGSNPLEGEIRRYNENLLGQQNHEACFANNEFTEYDIDGKLGLAHGFDEFFGWRCSSFATGLDRAAVCLQDEISDTDDLCHFFSGTTDNIRTVDMRNGNNVVAIDQTEGRVYLLNVADVQTKFNKAYGGSGLAQAMISKGSEQRVWAISSAAGVRAWTTSGLVRVDDPTALGFAVAAHNNTAYYSNFTHIVRNSVEAGTLNETHKVAISIVDDGGLRLSKDGNYLMAWTIDNTVYLLDASDLSTLETFTLDNTVISVDMDVRNNFLYVLTPTTVERFDVFDSTESLAGPGQPGQKNPQLVGPVGSGGQFDEPTTISEDVVTEDATPGDLFDVSGLEDGLGINTSAASLLVAALLILGLAGSVWFQTQSFGMAMGGAVVGFLLGFAFGFIPDWVLMFIVILAAAFIVIRLSGGRM